MPTGMRVHPPPWPPPLRRRRAPGYMYDARGYTGLHEWGALVSLICPRGGKIQYTSAMRLLATGRAGAQINASSFVATVTAGQTKP
jgi:hypothetical protein